MSYLVESITVGEVGEKNIEIRDSVTALTFALSASSVSEIKVTVHDPGFKMHNSNYFMIGRRVVYDKVAYEISAVEVKHDRRDSCVFTARLEATQKLRREKGQQNFGAISPTTFASGAAQRVGLRFFGESSPVDGPIMRESTDNKDESTMDVLQRLCRDLDFMCFEAKGILFFASQDFIMENQASLNINVPSEETDPFFASSLSARRTTDGRSAATMTAQLIKNESSLSIYPGAVVNITGLDHFTTFMVDKVNYSASPSALVSISGSSPEDDGEAACALQSFTQGARGDCVKRIQQAIGTTADGVWGPITQRYVLSFQKANNLPADGVWDADDWAEIKTDDYVRGSSGFVAKPSTTTSTIKISDIFYADKAVNGSKGWEYVRTNKKLPLPYPWNYGNWNPEEGGYDGVVYYMNQWLKYLNNNSTQAIYDSEVIRFQNRFTPNSGQPR